MSMTHIQYARSLGIEPSIIEQLIDEELLFTVERKHGSAYFLEHPLPSKDEVIAAARSLYERRLQTALQASRRLKVELEAIHNDLLEALDHGLNPVLPLGNDVLVAGGPHNPRSPLDSARHDLSYALLGVELAHRGLHDHDQSQRLTSEEPAR